MLVLRLARNKAPLLNSIRCLATAAPPHPTSAASPSYSSLSSSSSSASSSSVIPLSNVEAQWEKLSKEDQLIVHQQLEELQKKDWKTLSLDEKKAAYYVAFGPHGPRRPLHPPGSVLKIILGTAGSLAAAVGLYVLSRHYAGPPPRTLNKEWEEAANKRAIEMKLNPITGVSSEGYKGKGFVQHDK